MSTVRPAIKESESVLGSVIRGAYGIVGWLDRVFYGIVILMVAAMTFAIGYEVFVRYVLNSPTVWATEVAGYLLVGTSFLAAAYVARKNHHPRVDALLNLLPPKAQLTLNGLTTILSLVFTVVLTWQGWIMAWNALMRDSHSSTLLRAPLFYPMVTISIGAAILSLELLFTFLYKLTHKEAPSK